MQSPLRLALLTGVLATGLTVAPEASAQPGPGRNLLLLVACNEYPVLRKAWLERAAKEEAQGTVGAVARAVKDYEQSKRLLGPVNDVVRFEQHFRLCNEPPALVIRLATLGVAADPVAGTLGTPPDSRPPTLANILAAMRSIEEGCQPGDRVTALFAGHGAPVPDDNGDESDGWDEAFLPEDTARWDGKDVQGALRDDVILKFAQAIHKAGGSLWGIFASCHSGTMSRGATDGAVARELSQDDLGIPSIPWTGVDRDDPLPPSCTFLYAAHSRERAWERAAGFRRPAGLVEQALGATVAPAERMGDLVFALCYALRTAGAGMTFRELHGRIAEVYRREGIENYATPGLEGASALRVGSRTEEPVPTLLLTRKGTDFELSEGRLWGLVEGTILRVLDADRTTVRGYVEVSKAHPLEAECRWLTDWPADVRDRPSSLPPAPPELAQAACEVVHVPLTESLLRVALLDEGGQALSLPGPLPPEIANAARTRVRWESDPREATWHVIAKAGGTYEVRPSTAEAGGLTYPADGATLEPTLARLAKVHALLHAAREAGNLEPLQEALRVRLFVQDAAKKLVEVLPGSALRPGDPVQFVLENVSPKGLYVDAFYIEANASIDQAYPGAGQATEVLGPGKTLKLPREPQPLGDGSQGPEHLLVFVQEAKPDANGSPAGESRGRRHFDWVAQGPLPIPPQQAGARSRGKGEDAPTGVGRLLFSIRTTWGALAAPPAYPEQAVPRLDATVPLLAMTEPHASVPGAPQGESEAALPPECAGVASTLLGIVAPTGVRTAVGIDAGGTILAPCEPVLAAGRFRADGRFAVPLRRLTPDERLSALLVAVDRARGLALLRLETLPAGWAKQGHATLAEAMPASGTACSVLRLQTGRPFLHGAGTLGAVVAAPEGLLRRLAERMGVPPSEAEPVLAELRASAAPRIAMVGPGVHDDGWLLDPSGRCIGLVVQSDAPGVSNAGSYALPIEEIRAFLESQRAAGDGVRPAWVPMPQDFGAWTAWDPAARVALRGSRVRPNTVLVDFEAGLAGLASANDADFAVHLGQERRIAWYARYPQTPPGSGFDLILIDETNDEYADVVLERTREGAWVTRPGAGALWLSVEKLSKASGDGRDGFADRIAVATAVVRSLTR